MRLRIGGNVWMRVEILSRNISGFFFWIALPGVHLSLSSNVWLKKRGLVYAGILFSYNNMLWNAPAWWITPNLYTAIAGNGLDSWYNFAMLTVVHQGTAVAHGIVFDCRRVPAISPSAPRRDCSHHRNNSIKRESSTRVKEVCLPRGHGWKIDFPQEVSKGLIMGQQSHRIKGFLLDSHKCLTLSNPITTVWFWRRYLFIS